MINIKLNGMIQQVSEVKELTNTKRKYQKILIRVDPTPDSLGRITGAINYFDVFIYGEKEILSIWSNYNDKLPDPPVTVLGNLVGKLKLDKNKNEYNNITIRANKIIFNYDNN